MEYFQALSSLLLCCAHYCEDRFHVYFLNAAHIFDFHGLRSHLVLEHGAQVRFLMGTNMIIPFFQVPTPEFGHQAREKPCTLVLNRALIYWVTQCLSTAPFCAGAAALVLGYQV